MLPARLVEVEDDVQFAHVGEVRLEQLDKEVDRLEGQQLVVVDVHSEGEEQARVSPVDKLVRPELVPIRGAERVHDRAGDTQFTGKGGGRREREGGNGEGGRGNGEGERGTRNVETMGGGKGKGERGREKGEGERVRRNT